MPSKNNRVLVVFDLPEPPPQDQNYKEELKTFEWECEADVIHTLEKKLGFEVKAFGVFDNVHPLIEEIKLFQPNIIFNMCESFRNERNYEPNIAGLYELLGVPYTGASPYALRICQDKSLTKKILAFNGIRVPEFTAYRRKKPIGSLKDFPYPAIIKPLGFEGSEGIAQTSLAENEKDCLERVQFVHESLDADAIVEEFIEGREIYVSIMGQGKIQAFPPREIFFHQVPEGEPKFATYNAKWDLQYRKKWGIRNGPANALPEQTEKKLFRDARAIYKLFRIESYARIDFRITAGGEVVFLEANPNPNLTSDEDFAKSALKAGVEYPDLIGKILSMGERRYDWT